MELLMIDIGLRSSVIPSSDTEMVEALLRRLDEFTQRNLHLRFQFLSGIPMDAGWVPYARAIRALIVCRQRKWESEMGIFRGELVTLR